MSKFIDLQSEQEKIKKLGQIRSPIFTTAEQCNEWSKLLSKTQGLQTEIKQMQKIIDAIEDWAIVDFNEDLLAFIRILKNG